MKITIVFTSHPATVMGSGMECVLRQSSTWECPHHNHRAVGLLVWGAPMFEVNYWQKKIWNVYLCNSAEELDASYYIRNSVWLMGWFSKKIIATLKWERCEYMIIKCGTNVRWHVVQIYDH